MIRRVGVSRLIRLDDAPAVAELYRTNQDFLAPWMPLRGRSFFTVAGRGRAIAETLALYRQGVVVPHVILDGTAVAGRATLSNISRDAFQSCNLGYWVGEAHNGKGLATAAVGELKRVAFDELDLHRIEAGTLLHNERSQAVLKRNGFVRIGIAAAYLKIGGVWQDHVLYQALSEPGSDN